VDVRWREGRVAAVHFPPDSNIAAFCHTVNIGLNKLGKSWAYEITFILSVSSSVDEGCEQRETLRPVMNMVTAERIRYSAEYDHSAPLK
jgi:hypothetical protein